MTLFGEFNVQRHNIKVLQTEACVLIKYLSTQQSIQQEMVVQENIFFWITVNMKDFVYLIVYTSFSMYIVYVNVVSLHCTTTIYNNSRTKKGDGYI